MIGRVVSTKMIKSVVVLVENKKKDPMYGKIYLRTKKYLVDDPFNVKDGDIVEIVKVKPISKNKHFQINRVLGSDIIKIETAQLQVGAEEAIAEVLPEKEELTANSLQLTDSIEQVNAKEEIEKKPRSAKKITEIKEKKVK